MLDVQTNQEIQRIQRILQGTLDLSGAGLHSNSERSLFVFLSVLWVENSQQHCMLGSLLARLTMVSLKKREEALMNAYITKTWMYVRDVFKSY